MTTKSDRLELMRCQQAAILHLRSCNMSDGQIARALGYRDSSSLSHTLSGRQLIGSVPSLRLARLADRQGYDGLARIYYSSPTRPSANGTVTDEVMDLARITGQIPDAEGDPTRLAILAAGVRHISSRMTAESDHARNYSHLRRAA